MMNGKRRRKLHMALCMLLIGLWIPTIVCNAGRLGSIRIDYHGKTNVDTHIALDEATFAYYNVGTVENGTWKTTGAFRKSCISLEDRASSSRMEQAKKLYEYAVQKKLPRKTVKTNGKGIADITGLKEGIYLIGQTEDWTRDQIGTFRSAPFLVPIPMITEKGNELLNVIVHPKNEWVEPEKPGEGDTLPPKEEIPDEEEGAKTGDPYMIEMWIHVMGVSLLVIVFLLYLSEKEEQW